MIFYLLTVGLIAMLSKPIRKVTVDSINDIIDTININKSKSTYQQQIDKFTNVFIDVTNKYNMQISLAQFLAVLRTETSTMNLTKNNDEIFGDKNLTNKAYGFMQVRKPALIDVNNYYDTSFNENDLLLEDVNVFVGCGYLNMCFLRAEYNIQQSFRKYNGGIGLTENKSNAGADLYSAKAFSYYKKFSELLVS